MPISTRPATPADIPALVELMEEFYAESDFPLDRQWAAASFSALLSDDRLGAVWLVLHEGVPSGYVALTVRFSMEYGGLDGFIDDLFVRPAHRRHGLGRAALEELFAECERRGLLAVHVEVGQDNIAANALYGSFGLTLRQDRRQTLTVRLGSPADLARRSGSTIW